MIWSTVTARRWPLVVFVVGALVASLTVTTTAVAQPPADPVRWARALSGSGDERGNAVAVDGSGNVITTGRFDGTVDFDPGPGVTNLTSLGLDDAFVTKFSPAGNLLWARRIGGTSGDEARAVAVDSAGNVVLTGYFAGTVDFDPGAGVFELTSFTAASFILKLDTNGAFVWALENGQAVLTGGAEGKAVAIDGDDNIAIAFSFTGSIDLDPDPAVEQSTTSLGGFDPYVMVLTPAGDRIFSQTLGGGGDDEVLGVAFDTAGDLHVTGYRSSSLGGQPFSGGTDAFVAKFDIVGNFVLWVRMMGGAGADAGHGVAVDAAGNVITTGRFVGTGSFGGTSLTSAGGNDVFMSKIGPTGTSVWAFRVGAGGNDVALDVAVDGSGNAIATGIFSLDVDFDPGAGVLTLPAFGSGDIFVAKYDPAGGVEWARGMGGNNIEEGLSTAADASGNVVTTGRFRDTTDFDPGPGVSNLTSVGGSDDAFVVKLDALGRLTVPTCDGLPVTVDIGAGQVPTAGADVILGTAGADVISGLGGGDTICGLGGNDTIAGGPGNDRILGGADNDTIFGGDDNDTIFGEGGNDSIQGNAGIDAMTGDAGNDTVSGNDGDDIVEGGDDDDTLFGGAGADSITGDGGNDTIQGGIGNDDIDGWEGDDLISGNSGNDVIDGYNGADTLYGVDGDDTLDGENGIDTIQGGIGADLINGGDGNDALSGNQNNDTINGGTGDDAIYGVDGNDILNGNAGVDTVLGGNNDDTINGGDDNDLLSGNLGIDIVNGDAGDDEVYGADGNDTLNGGTGIDVILGGNNNDTINSLDGIADQVSGNAGTDTCTRDAGIDAVFACENLLP